MFFLFLGGYRESSVRSWFQADLARHSKNSGPGRKRNDGTIEKRVDFFDGSSIIAIQVKWIVKKEAIMLN